MTQSNDEMNQLSNQWKALEQEIVELDRPIPQGPQYPDGAVPIPISNLARQKAAQMAAICPDTNCQASIEQNLLATIVVHDYLILQGYLPDLAASDCWNPLLGRMGLTADLEVSQIGRLECCAMAPQQTSCKVPEEGQWGRVSYIAVELDQEACWGWLLGFKPANDPINNLEKLERGDLLAIDELGLYLQRLRSLWMILQESSEPWPKELRTEIVVLLERIYRTQSSIKRPARAAQEVSQLYDSELLGTSDRELVTSNREKDSSTNRDLKRFLRNVFDQLEDALILTEESGFGR